ncbi:MAG: Crp/Fnr family transcriptional regulator [Microcystaceae cyanobacterium]
MAKTTKSNQPNLLEELVQKNYLFRGLTVDWLANYLDPDSLKAEKLFSNRPIYTAFLPNQYLEFLYVTLGEGLVITRSTPLDRIIAITYSHSCFGMQSLDFSYGLASQAFPCLVEAYKTTQVIKVPKTSLENIYTNSELFRDKYRMLFELNQKFTYHLLNCSAYPPQAVAALLRALIYQERELGNQPQSKGYYQFDLPIDVIARACQLNQRTVEQVLKGMQQIGLISSSKEDGEDILRVLAPEELKEVYSATREKVSWWPLRS